MVRIWRWPSKAGWDDPPFLSPKTGDAIESRPKSVAILRGQRLHFANWNRILNMGQRSKSPLKNGDFSGEAAVLIAFLVEHQHFRIIVAIFFWDPFLMLSPLDPVGF